MPLLWGGGFDGAPELIAVLARGRELLGNRPELVRRITDPMAFAATCSRLGVPSLRFAPIGRSLPEGWLVKQRGASGGWHVRDAGAVPKLGPGDYLQRRVAGRPVRCCCWATADAARRWP